MYSSSITVDQVIDALAAFLTPFVGTSEIIRAQVNRVPMPKTACVVLTELLQVDLTMPDTSYDPTNDAALIAGEKRIDVQIDFYGEQASEYCAVIKQTFRSAWGFDHFPVNCRPLYTSDGIQAPMITGEQQWQARWTLTVSLQYNPIVTVPQDFAGALAPNTVLNADA
jgi:hypothetical protein